MAPDRHAYLILRLNIVVDSSLFISSCNSHFFGTVHFEFYTRLQRWIRPVVRKAVQVIVSMAQAQPVVVSVVQPDQRIEPAQQPRPCHKGGSRMTDEFVLRAGQETKILHARMVGHQAGRCTTMLQRIDVRFGFAVGEARRDGHR